MNSKALIIDDERDICELIEMSLMGQNIQCDSAFSVRQALRKLKNNEYSFVICDVKLPDGDGLDLLNYIQKQYPGLPVSMITAHGDMNMAITALKRGAFDFINKPFELKQLRDLCQAAEKQARNDRSAKQRAEKPKKGKSTTTISSSEADADDLNVKLVGSSEGMLQVKKMIGRVARSQAPVFIQGESGTGKEVVARLIHQKSTRADGPFIAVNCGAIPENLVESEFFGYKKGAFTGANYDQDGLFIAANGGTLFLDEIADLPLNMQVKLLRAIQERSVRPIGSAKEEFFDVRILSATHQDLAHCVQEKQFREDLYYRLNVISLNIPPLRDRQEDIPELSAFLLQHLAKRHESDARQLSDKALDKLQSYAFPGNVRELENILERALTFADSDIIEADELSLERTSSPTANARENSELTHEAKEGRTTDELFLLDEDVPDDLEGYMQDIEKQVLLKALEDCDYNKTKATERLGISFRAMRYKLKKLGVD
ncbi:sigma-54 dependent transcriptional regulator [Suttonella sp. R2A3]|uniref:sigma-54-dependent transcriptional regulator n=1 Tax=Suttonella sp. R2A3 TaxID=2908648 RepID=UPI001F2FD2A7|nr:sigma-54 dependent transcriptional regulator [Suttonella sp. R2A3]UJF24858.1 sigma-54 dependent transcriptional regulator [Suttonella sp. R2A3]